MSDFLGEMATLSSERAALLPRFRSRDLDKPLVPLRFGAFDIIAEIKARSPAEGVLAAPGEDRCVRARQYAEAGALAVSVLTEPSRFGGDPGHLREVAAAIPEAPVMRKDFLVDVAQVLESRAAGASGILLIVAMLPDRKLREMLDCAAELGLFVLVEAFDLDDVTRLRALLNDDDAERAGNGGLLFGVNARNLRTLAVDLDRLAALAGELPGGRSVAESGVVDADDAARAAALGYRAALVGTALMRSAAPGRLIGAMRDAGRLAA